MSSESASARDLWAATVDIVKDRINNRSLWEALESATPVTLAEDGTLVVGLEPHLAAHSGQLNVADHRRAIQSAAEHVAGRPITFRLIEGHTLEDWEVTQKREQVIALKREAGEDRRSQPIADANTWDGVYEQAMRAFSALTLRQLPQTKARYLADMLFTLSDAMDRLGDGSDEASARMVARIIDRIAGNAEVPATLVALELDRLRSWSAQNTG